MTIDPGSLPAGLPAAYCPIGLLLKRPMVTAPFDASIADAVRVMVGESVSSVVIVDPISGSTLGIFTLRDLIRRVSFDPSGMAEPIATVMTAGLVTLPGSAAVHQAATLMARRRLSHIVVVDESDRAIGVVTQTDLIGASRLGTQELAGDITEADSIHALVAARPDVKRLTQHLLEQRVGADSVTQLVVGLNDLVTTRVIELTADEIELPDLRWCWVALGSEGRLEQSLATDQDNGIIFEAEGEAVPAFRDSLVHFAQRVNERLAECGFPLCKGGIMAGNPRWCLSLGEWQERFGHWIDHPQPEALLNASIFFDLRPLYGESRLAERLREEMLAKTRAAPLFLRLMATNAIACRPALGLFDNFRFDNHAQYPHTIELKLYGSRPFVDAARVLALANGVPYTNTAQRLTAVAAGMRFGGDDVRAIVDAFWFVQSLRLRNQAMIERTGTGIANRLDPDGLNKMDRSILKEAFRQARTLQNHLRADFQL